MMARLYALLGLTKSQPVPEPTPRPFAGTEVGESKMSTPELKDIETIQRKAPKSALLTNPLRIIA